MKHEYKKHEKEIYNPKHEPQLLTVGKQKYFCIKGKGNPNDEDFSARVGVLYALAYAVRMMPKKGFTPEGYFEYTVYPLEGLWSLSEDGIKEKEETGVLNKAEFEYTIMIRQPDFVNQEVIERAFEMADQKLKSPLLKEAYFEEIEDGLSLQILHEGAFDDEPASFEIMQRYMKEKGYTLRSKIHREIYLSDTRKVSKDKLKTILRYRIQ